MQRFERYDNDPKREWVGAYIHDLRSYARALIPLRPAFGVYLLFQWEKGESIFEGASLSNFPFR